jgi:hypothetical protein
MQAFVWSAPLVERPAVGLPARAEQIRITNRRFEAPDRRRRGDLVLPGALARRGGDLLHQRAENFLHVFKG